MSSFSFENLSLNTKFLVQHAHTISFSSYTKSLRVLLSVDDMLKYEYEASQRVVLKHNNSIVVCCIWPSTLVSSGTVHISPMQRNNLNCEVGSHITIHPLDSFESIKASTIHVKILSDIDGSLYSNNEFKDFVSKMLSDITYLSKGFVFEFIFKGRNRVIELGSIHSISNKPNEPNESNESNDIINKLYRFYPKTLVEFPKPDSEFIGIVNNVSYDSIGGLENEIKQIKQIIESPLFNPEKFLLYGLNPPRGILLYGPPGTGKTLIARAVAQETKAHFITINTFDILSSYYGDSESKLRSIFKTAQEQSPCIIFIDEIDGLCPKRESSTGVEQRIVTTLLVLMDGISTSKDSRVMVLGTTNRPDSIDEALRRPGRFDHEIEIGIPEFKQRVSILKALLKDIKHSLSDDDIIDIASKAHGYVGADLGNIVKEAGICLLRQVHEQFKFNESIVDNICLNLEHVLEGFSKTKPSAMREIALEVPKVRWDDIGGQEETKQRLKEAIEWPIKNPEAFIKFGIKPPKGILLYGPPGCSKTLMAKALATESGINFLAIKGPELFNKYVGESEKAVAEIFRKARAASPSILFFDEIDAIASKRGSGGQGVSVGDRVISQLLTELDGINSLSNVTVVAATNRPDVIDSALMRPGRLDRILYVGAPDLESRCHILKIKFSKMAIGSDVDINELSIQTDGYSGAEMVALCQEAGYIAMEEDIQIDSISSRHFQKAIKKITPRITPEMIDFYKEFQARSGLSTI